MYKLLVDAPPLEWIRRTLVPKKIRNAIKAKLTMKNRPKINEQNREYLTQMFDQDLGKLGQLFGINLSVQSYKGQAHTKELKFTETSTLK